MHRRQTLYCPTSGKGRPVYLPHTEIRNSPATPSRIPYGDRSKMRGKLRGSVRNTATLLEVLVVKDDI